MVSNITGTPKEEFLKVCEILASTSVPNRTTTILYALGWTQHSVGSQMIRTAALMQLLLGNIGMPGGGINALRGHSNIQGLTDLGLLSNLLPGYLTLPNEKETDYQAYVGKRTLKPLRPNQLSYWSNYPKFHVSLMKSWWGDKATKAGYSLPYSAGLSVQYLGSESLLIIDNLMVGFNNGPMYNLDGIVRFDEAKARAEALTVRPDIWLFPFLNVYGILGKAQASTDVNFGVWVPDSTGVDKEVLKTGTIVDFNTTTFGFGITPTIGVGGGFLALDMNLAWVDVPQLSNLRVRLYLDRALERLSNLKNRSNPLPFG
jgi:hypothetical protein